MTKLSTLSIFGITEDGRNNRYSEEELKRYKKAVNDKVLLHRKHKTDLIYTFSSYKDGRDLLEHLNEELLKHGFNPNRSLENDKKLFSNDRH